MANIDQVQLPDGSQYHIIDDTSGYATTTYVQNQISTINKNSIGLGNVDNTADINKPVSLPQQAALNGKVDDDIVAYVESDTTATKRYEVGDQFILNGVLYTATAIIAVNDTIVIGTNCDVSDTLVEQNDALSAQIDTKTDQSLIATVQPNLTAVKAYAVGEQFVYQGLLYKATAAISSGGTITINGNCTLAEKITEQIGYLEERDISNRFSSNQSNVFISAKKNNNGTVTVNLSAKGSFGNGAIVFYPDASIPVPTRLRDGYLGLGKVVNTDSTPVSYVNALALIDVNGIFYILYEQAITANIVEFSVTYPLS